MFQHLQEMGVDFRWHIGLRATIQSQHCLNGIGNGMAVGTFGEMLFDFSAQGVIQFTLQKIGELCDEFSTRFRDSVRHHAFRCTRAPKGFVRSR